MNSVTNNLPMNFSYLDSPGYRLRARQRIIALSVCRHLAVDLRSPSRLDSRSWLRSPAPRLTLPNEQAPSSDTCPTADSRTRGCTTRVAPQHLRSNASAIHLGNLVDPDPSNPPSDSPGASTAPFSRASRQAIPDGDRQLAGTSVAVASHLVAQIGEAHPV